MKITWNKLSALRSFKLLVTSFHGHVATLTGLIKSSEGDEEEERNKRGENKKRNEKTQIKKVHAGDNSLDIISDAPTTTAIILIYEQRVYDI